MPRPKPSTPYEPVTSRDHVGEQRKPELVPGRESFVAVQILHADAPNQGVHLGELVQFVGVGAHLFRTHQGFVPGVEGQAPPGGRAPRTESGRRGPATPSTSSTDGRVKSGAIAPTSGVLAMRNPHHSAETRHPEARDWMHTSSDLEAVAHAGFGQQMLGPGRIGLELAAQLGHVLAQVLRLVLVGRAPHASAAGGAG